MKRSEYLLKENKKKEEKKPLKRSEYLLKSPIGMTSGILTSSPQTDARKVTAAPKKNNPIKDKNYDGVDAEINRREASRSARYSMQPEVRAAEIKRAEARGDTKRGSELKKATDIEQWAKEQVNSDFVRSRAQTVYDNEFNAAKLRGDQSPAVAAEHAAQGYLDLFRNKPQETRNETYAYRQAEKIQEVANVFGSDDFGKMSESGKLIGINLDGNLPKSRFEKIITFVNNDPYRNSIEALAIMNHGDSNLAKQISQLTEDEKKIIRYYAARGEKDKVEEFYKLMERELNERLQTTVNEQTRQEAYDKPILGAAKNIVGTMASPAAYIENAGNAVANVFRDDYIPTDYNTPAFKGAHMAEQTNEGVTKRASDAVGGGAAGEVASLIAGTGLSIANQIATLPLGAAGSLAYMTAESAGQTTLDALKRGASAEQALLLGSVSGAIEAITEKIPLDNLFEMASEIGEKGFKKFIKTLVKNSPKQGITEMGEEAISEIANTILDIAVMKEKSGYEQYIAELMKNGMTRTEAEKEALINYVGANTLKAGASGFLSGLVMGGGATAVSKVNTAIESRNAGAAEGEAGFTKNEYSEKVSNKTIRALDAIGKALGVNISIGAPTGNAPGAYNGYYQNGNIVIAQDAEDPLKVVLSHEVTHHLQKYNPEAYGKFLEIAVNASEELTGIQKNEMLEGYKKWFSEGAETEFTDAEVLDDVAADFAGKIVDNLDLFRSLVRSDMTVAERFVESVKDFITKVESTFSKDKLKMDTASLDKYGVKISELEEATKQWSEMLKATKAEAKSGNVEIENTAETEQGGGRKYLFKGYDEKTGRGIYESNFPIGTPKTAKGKRILELVQNVWSKKPIELTLKDGRKIKAVFDPTYDPTPGAKTDLSKLMGGNRHGNSSEQRVTLSLADDYYQIASEATHNYSKEETGKDIETHKDVKQWHYFINDILFQEIGEETLEPYRVTINIKEKDDGTFVYSFNAEKQEKGSNTRQTLHADVTTIEKDGGNVESFNNSIPDSSGKSNPQNSLKKNTDNQGRELSAEQAEYFKDSKVRDNDGNLVTVYHGTQRGGFTVFNRTYNWYTDNSEMAHSYTQNPEIYEGYLNIKKPYIIDAKEDKWSGIAIDDETKELLDQYGSSTFEEDGKWRTSTADIVSAVFDAIEEGEADYDGVIILNVNDFGSYYKGDINGIGNDYISFKSSQFKSIDNKKPTENPDIRYSLKGKKPIEPDAERKAERERMRELEAENAKQKKLIEQLKDRMKDMSPNRIAGQVDEKAVRKAARDFIQRYSATVKASDLAPKLKKLWDRMGTGKNLSWEEVSAEAKAIATEIAESAVEKDDTLYQEFADLRKFCREVKFTISESDRSNIPDFEEFRKRNMGKLKIAYGKTNIDDKYKELGEMYPGLFDEEKISNPADQLLHIAEVLNDVYDITESNPFKSNMDYAVNSIANDILETFYEIPENKKTFQEMKIQRLERTVLERDAQIKETVKNLTEYHKSVEKMLSEWEKKQKDIEEKKMALKEDRERFYEKQDERKKRAQIIRATNRLSQKLRWATDKKHIPHELQGAVARFLEYVNLTGLYTYDEKGKLQKSDDGSPTQKSLTYRQLRAIYQQYDGEFTFPPEFLEGVFEDGEQRGDILGQIYDLRETRVAEMNREQLDVILKGVKIVETAVKNADIMFSNSRFKEISSLAENIKEDAPIKNKFVENRFKSMLKQILDIDNLTPQAYFHRLGAGGDAIFNMLSEAEAKRTRIVQKVGEFTEKLLDPKKRRELEESTVKVELGGEDIEMSVAQIMELYALSRRKQAEKHILEGGVIIEGIPGKKGEKRREPIRASVREIGEAINNLTPEQRKLAEQLSKFASDKLGGYMNEACKKVFGYEKFGEINYWPIRIDDRTIHKKADTADAARATPTIRNFGMAKGLTHGANNALKIGSIFDTFAEHASQSATYAAYLGAMEDMRRVINYTYGDGEGMQHVLDGVFGIHEKKVNGKVEDTHPGIDYWNKLYEDINGGMKPKDGGSPFDPFLRNAKLSSIAANARVIIQQPTAYIRAASEIDPKYLVGGTIHAKRGWERALKYAPIAQQKDWGRADIGTGQTMKEILFGLDGTIPKIQETSMWLAGKADAAAWGSLWSACEKEIKDKHKKIKPDSDAFYDAVTKRFTQIINKTQVVDGVLQRSQNMRKQNALVKLGTMFMSEPTKQYNMIASAVYDLANSENKEKKKTAKRKLARTATALIFSTVINAAAQSIIDAMRDDDEEKKYWEKWLSAFLGLPEEGEKGKDAAKSIIGGNLVEGLNPIGYFPFAKDLWSIAQGYDVKRTDVEGIADFVQAVVEAGKSITGEGNQSIASGVNDLIASGASLFGIPYASFKRDIGAFLQTIIQGIGNPVLDYNVAKLTKNIRNAKNADFFIDILYKAKTEDKDAFKIIYKDMVKNGFKKEDIDKDIETYTSKKFDRALSSARKAKEAENATAEDKVLYKHLNREKNMKRAERAGDEDTVLDNLDKYRANVEKYLKEYPGKDEEKKIDYAYRKANYATYGAEYAIRASGGKSVYDKALEKVNRGKTTWKDYYEEYFGKDERRYEKLRDKYDISYAEYEAIAQAMSKNSTEEEEIEALHKLGYKRSTARGIRRNFNKVK